MKISSGEISGSNYGFSSDLNKKKEAISYFILAVLGFSFWFFMTVPFASHRETYWWLAMVPTNPFVKAFGIISSTYRPLAQGATWSAFVFLDPHIFPTSLFRQVLLQGFIYAMFLLAWWLIYSKAPQRRLFALVACVAGGVFFSGYVHLFHLYGLFYVPVMLILGALLRFHASRAIDNREIWLAIVATLLVFWHPFATGLFVGFYFGYYLETFWKRNSTERFRGFAIFMVGLVAIATMVLLFPRSPMPIGTRLAGFLISYKTNEVNLVASFVAFLLAELTIVSMRLSAKVKLTTFLMVAILSATFVMKGWPILLIWVCVALVKLFRLSDWSLFFFTLAAALLPFGGGIGSPMYALFAIILAAYATSLDWPQVESALSVVFTPRVVTGVAIALAMVVVVVRAGIQVPVVTRLATPLLAERERTYQLENILAWLHESNYCACEVAFAEDAGSPVESVESAMNRRNRPPAWPGDIRLFWTNVLQCQKTGKPAANAGVVTVTFGDQPLPGSKEVYKVDGRYAGSAIVWIGDPQN